MKKLLSVVIAIIAILAMSIPAMAADVSTEVNIQNGAGTPPLVKAKWETSSGLNVESGDPAHTAGGVQIAPIAGFQAQTPVIFYAIVAPNGNIITHVYADVYYPLAGSDPGPDGSLKFEVELTSSLTGDTARDYFNTAYGASGNTIVTVNPATNVADIREELHQGEATLWWGEYYLDNCELAGCYRVEINAATASNLHGLLDNELCWMPLTMAEYDFNAVNYSASGDVQVGADIKVGGDGVWDIPTAGAPTPNKATIRNIGNTYLTMTIKQDDMGMGSTIGVWNVHYDARLGAAAAYTNFDPVTTKGAGYAALASAAATVVPQVLRLCALEKVDLSIHVDKDPVESPTDIHTYSGTMILGQAFSAGPPDVGTAYGYAGVPPAPLPYPTLVHP